MMSNDPEQKDRKDLRSYVRMSSRSYVMCAQRRRAGWDVRPSLHELTAIKRSGELDECSWWRRRQRDFGNWHQLPGPVQQRIFILRGS